MMSKPEPLIAEYNLTDWMNDSYTGTDALKKSIVNPLKVNYKGILRRQTATAGGHAKDDEDGED
jgi:hypothetical protein